MKCFWSRLPFSPLCLLVSFRSISSDSLFVLRCWRYPSVSLSTRSSVRSMGWSVMPRLICGNWQTRIATLTKSVCHWPCQSVGLNLSVCLSLDQVIGTLVIFFFFPLFEKRAFSQIGSKRFCYRDLPLFCCHCCCAIVVLSTFPCKQELFFCYIYFYSFSFVR